MAACHAAAHNTIEAHSPARWGPQPASGTYEEEPTSGESAKERHEAAARPWAVPAAVTSVALVYGSWALIAKAAIEGAGASPLVLAAYRCCGGSLAMLLVHRLCGAGAPGGAAPAPSRGLAEIAAADRPRFVLLGALMACNVGGNILALQRLPALTVSALQPLVPVVTSVVSVFLGVERLSNRRAAGIVLAAVGAVVVVSMGPRHAGGSGGAPPGQPQGAGEPQDRAPARGVLFLAVNVCGGALYTVLQKEVVHAYPPALCASAAFLVAAAIVLPGALGVHGAEPHVWRLGGSPGALAAALYSVLLATAYNYIVLAWANRESSPATVTGLLTLQPGAAALLSWVFLGQPPTLGQATGGAAVASGLVCLLRAPAGRRRASAPAERCPARASPEDAALPCQVGRRSYDVE